MLHRNWRSGAFTNLVDRYIALSQFAAARFAAQGLPRERIVIKPNFVDSPEPPSAGGGGYAVFAGAALGGEGRAHAAARPGARCVTSR